MILTRVRHYCSRIRLELEAAISEEYTPHQIAGSFALGIFITALPTLGAGLVVFAVLSYLFSWLNKLALFASVLVLNPAVKSVVYVASFQVGAVLFGPTPIETTETGLLETAVTLTRQLLVGNLLIALALAAVGYVAVHWLTVRSRRHTHPVSVSDSMTAD